MKHGNRMVLGFGWLAFVFAAGPAAPQSAAPADADLDEIVVVANRSERPLRDVAANVTVLTGSAIDAELATSLAEALRYTPGIDYEGAGTRFGTEGFSIRGIGGNRVALLVDGVPLSDQFDIGNFSNATRDFVDAGFVDRAEILHGPASALYGSSAIGGVVALRSPDPARLASDGTAGGRFSSVWHEADAGLHGTVLQALQGRRVGMIAGFSARDGRQSESAAAASPDSRAYARRSAMFKLTADDASGNRLGFGYYGQQSDVESDLKSMLGSGRFRSTTMLRGGDDYRMDLVSAGYEFDVGAGPPLSGRLQVYHGRTDVLQRTVDERMLAPRPVVIDRVFSFEQTVTGADLNLQGTITSGNAVHRLGAGIEMRRRRTEEQRDGLETGLEDGLTSNVILGEVFPLRDFPLSESIDAGAYVEDAISIGRMTFIGALRRDRYELRAENDPVYAEDNPFSDPVSLSDAEWSPKLGMIYRAGDALDLYVQFSHGFRAPPYEDANIGLDLPQFNVRAIPNPDLRSERSNGIDVGFRWRGERATARLAVFRNSYDDFIESKVRLGADPATGIILFQSQNIREAVIEGVEAGWSLTLPVTHGALTTSGSLYLARGENRVSGESLNSVGPAEAVVGIDWLSASERWYAGIRATLTEAWSELDESGGELFSPPSHAVIDLYLSRRVGESLRVRAGVGNLLDRTYWAWSDVRGLAPDDPVVPFLARPGRTLLLGLELAW